MFVFGFPFSAGKFGAGRAGVWGFACVIDFAFALRARGTRLRGDERMPRAENEDGSGAAPGAQAGLDQGAVAESQPEFRSTESLVADLKLVTVCEEAQCPNRWECWSNGTATFMIAGEKCTRACGFCAIKTAKPDPLEEDEPERVGEATRRMKLGHVVITAVARDDLEDGGAEHFARTIRAVRRLSPATVIEVLVPDFNDQDAAIKVVMDARPHIFNHNLETVRAAHSAGQVAGPLRAQPVGVEEGEGDGRRQGGEQERDHARAG